MAERGSDALSFPPRLSAGAVVSASGAARGAVFCRLGPTDAGGRVLPAVPAGRSQPLPDVFALVRSGQSRLRSTFLMVNGAYGCCIAA